MKIATYVDDDGTVVSVNAPGRLLVYDNARGEWAAVGRIAFAIRPDMGLAEVKAAVRKAAARLEGGTAFLSADGKGLVHAILQEEFGLHTWKSQGSLRNQLDAVAAGEAALAARPSPPPVRQAGMGCGCLGGRGGGPRLKRTLPPDEIVSCAAMERVGEGHYRIDLASALKNDSSLNSRMVLVPVLEGGMFTRLEIVCDHLPRWFPEAVADLDLKARYREIETGVLIEVHLEHGT